MLRGASLVQTPSDVHRRGDTCLAQGMGMGKSALILVLPHPHCAASRSCLQIACTAQEVCWDQCGPRIPHPCRSYCPSAMHKASCCILGMRQLGEGPRKALPTPPRKPAHPPA